jgi:hypothetical protein
LPTFEPQTATSVIFKFELFEVIIHIEKASRWKRTGVGRLSKKPKPQTKITNRPSFPVNPGKEAIIIPYFPIHPPPGFENFITLRI